MQSNQFLIVTDGHGALIDPGCNMTANKACRLWANMVRGLDIESMVQRFIDWVETLECGIDLMTQDNYRIP